MGTLIVTFKPRRGAPTGLSEEITTNENTATFSANLAQWNGVVELYASENMYVAIGTPDDPDTPTSPDATTFDQRILVPASEPWCLDVAKGVILSAVDAE